MQNIELEAEAIQISIYTNIVLNILKTHSQLSVNKTLFFTYLLKKEKFRVDKVYTAKNTQDIIYKAISLIAGEYKEYCESIIYILKAIHLLISCKKVEINNNILCLISEREVNIAIYQESPFIQKAIEESKKMTDRQFMKEVVSNV